MFRALSKIFSLEKVFAYDTDGAQAERFVSELSEDLRINIEAVRDLEEAVKRSDICVTCTPSKRFFLRREYVQPGTFVAAVGADSEDKQELEPGLVASNKVVVDIVDQCASIGELHHALDSGLMRKDGVHAELGEIVASTKIGRTSDDEIIIFDSTGMALQDVIAAVAVYENAIASGRWAQMNFAA